MVSQPKKKWYHNQKKMVSLTLPKESVYDTTHIAVK